MEPLLLKVDDVAKSLGLGNSKTYSLIISGEIPSIRIGKSIRVPAAKLREYVARLNNPIPSVERGALQQD